MGSEFLSQDEVDALLKGVSGEADDAAEAKPEDGIRPYNLATQERIVRGRMPTLEIINDRFSRLLRISLFNFMRKNPEISVSPVRVMKYSEFIRNLVVPTNLNVVSMKPLRGSTLFIFEPTLVFTVVDSLFGGNGRIPTRVEGREFTATEQRIIQKMLGVVMADYAKAWEPVHAVTFEHVRSEMQTQFANIATPSEVVVTMSFKIELGFGAGSLHVCMPYATLEPIRDILYSTVQGDHFEPDRRWLRMLQKQVQIAEVELVAQLAAIDVPIQRVLSLKEGDILPFDMPSAVEASVDGVPLFECSYGTANGQYALRVGKILAVSREDNALGEEHA
jgi:flagellar motor switch protein FliM